MDLPAVAARLAAERMRSKAGPHESRLGFAGAGTEERGVRHLGTAALQRRHGLDAAPQQTQLGKG